MSKRAGFEGGRLPGLAGRSATTAALLLLVSCSSFDGTPSAEPADASTDNDGGPGVVNGQGVVPTISLTVTPGKQTWVRSRPNSVEFTVTRGKNVTGRVNVTIAGLSKSASVVDAVVEDGVTTGKVTFQPGADTLTGDQTLTLQASLVGTLGSASLPLDGFMRGAPGDVDSTFATNGVITIPAEEVSAVAPDGRIFTFRGDQTTERYTADGQIDVTFGVNGRGTFSNSGAVKALQVTATNVYAMFQGLGGGRGDAFLKTSLDGAPDTSFGTNGFSNYDGGTFMLLGVAMARSSTGQLAAVGVGQQLPRGGAVVWTTAAGTSGAVDDGNTDAPLGKLTAAAWDGVGLLVVGGGTLARVVTGTQHYNGAQFPGGGHVSLGATISLYGINLEGANILVSGVDTSSGAPFIAKLQPNANGPFAGFSFSPAAVTFDTTLGTKAFLASDGTILHVGRENNATTCVVNRYDATGKVDPGFGTNGVARLPVTPCQPGGVALQPDGKIIVDAGSLGTAPAVSSIVRVWN